MRKFLPSTKAITAHLHSYLDEAGPYLSSCIVTSKSSPCFREIYKVALAADVILEALEDDRIRPGIQAMRSVAVRIPLLVSIAQISVAQIELRRFLELCVWSIYFTHHPVEWQCFEGGRGKGFVRDAAKPISSAAHRDLSSYLAYAKEYMEAEPSGVALKALTTIESDKRVLNAATHAGDVARSPAGNLPFEKVDERILYKFGALHRRLLTSCLVLAAAFNREKFDKMSPEGKAHWQWLLIKDMQKRIRMGDFGLPL